MCQKIFDAAVFDKRKEKIDTGFGTVSSREHEEHGKDGKTFLFRLTVLRKPAL